MVAVVVNDCLVTRLLSQVTLPNSNLGQCFLLPIAAFTSLIHGLYGIELAAGLLQKCIQLFLHQLSIAHSLCSQVDNIIVTEETDGGSDFSKYNSSCKKALNLIFYVGHLFNLEVFLKLKFTFAVLVCF